MLVIPTKAGIQVAARAYRGITGVSGLSGVSPAC